MDIILSCRQFYSVRSDILPCCRILIVNLVFHQFIILTRYKFPAINILYDRLRHIIVLRVPVKHGRCIRILRKTGNICRQDIKSKLHSALIVAFSLDYYNRRLFIRCLSNGFVVFVCYRIIHAFPEINRSVSQHKILRADRLTCIEPVPVLRTVYHTDVFCVHGGGCNSKSLFYHTGIVSLSGNDHGGLPRLHIIFISNLIISCTKLCFFILCIYRIGITQQNNPVSRIGTDKTILFKNHGNFFQIILFYRKLTRKIITLTGNRDVVFSRLGKVVHIVFSFIGKCIPMPVQSSRYT